MATKRITATLVDAMRPGEVVWDTEARGFGCRYRARDRVYLVKTRIRGQQRVLTIGRHGRGAYGPESARREAQRLLGLIRDGKDPAADRDAEKSAPTLASFAVRFMAEYASAHHKPRTRAEADGLLRRYILPALGSKRLGDIGKADAARMHSSLRETPVAANRALALLSSMLTWAERLGERPDGTNPCRFVDRFPEKVCERLLGPADLSRLGEALTQAEAGQLGGRASPEDWRVGGRASPEDWRAVAAIRLLVFTGARVSEILTLRWEWIDTTQGVARLPDSKTGAKNVFLPPGALALLAALPRLAANTYVLPGDRLGAHFVGLAKPWQRIRAAAALPDLRLHDLRHAYASVAVAAGESLYVVGKVLGHRHVNTTTRYAHLAQDPAKAAADRTAARLADMMDPARVTIGAPVVPLPDRRS